MYLRFERKKKCSFSRLEFLKIPQNMFSTVLDGKQGLQFQKSMFHIYAKITKIAR